MKSLVWKRQLAGSKFLPFDSFSFRENSRHRSAGVHSEYQPTTRMEETTKLSANHLAFGDIEMELEKTRRVLERLPEEHFDWKPHEKSMPLGKLAFHVANLVNWQKMSLKQDGFDLASSPPPENGSNLPGRDDLLNIFDENVKALREVLINVPEETLGKSWTLRHGDHEIFTMTRADVLRQFSISHMIHHRAQLTVYLRMLDVPVPGIYGPSGDEN